MTFATARRRRFIRRRRFVRRRRSLRVDVGLVLQRHSGRGHLDFDVRRAAGIFLAGGDAPSDGRRKPFDDVTSGANVTKLFYGRKLQIVVIS
jgi:hypothetical protein